MTFDRNKLYSIIFVACLAGYIWLYLNISKQFTASNSVEVCLIKYITNIPCPSCGSTRSIILLTKGNIYEALMINPIGFVVAIIMLLAPLWIMKDIASRSSTLFDFYHKIESFLKRPKYAIPLILLVVINWIWNIIKGL